MKGIKKIVALGIGVLMSASILTGCSADSMALYNAFNKSQEIKTAKTNTEMTLKVTATNQSAQEKQFTDTFLSMLNNTTISATSIMKQNDDRTKAEMEAKIKANLGDMPLDMGLWINTDLTSSKPVIKEVVKFPSIVALQLPQQFAGKEYMVMDYDDMVSAPGMDQVDFSKIMEFSKDFQGKLVEFLSKYAAQYKPTLEMVKKVDSQTIVQDGVSQAVDVYELKLDDKSFKEILKYTATNFAQNKDAISFIKEYLISSLSISGLPEEELKNAKAEIEKAFADYEKNLPEVLNQINKTFDQIKDIKILGEKGINIKFYINSHGFIVKEDGTLQFVLDLGAISKLDGNASTDGQQLPTGAYTIELKYNNDITNINKPVTINFPQTTKENSFTYSELLNAVTPTTPEKPVIETGWVNKNGKWYYNDANGVSKKGWLRDAGTWYYLDKDGVMATGWVKDGGTWYFLNTNGSMATGWVKQGGTWYYLHENGSMATGWIQSKGTWYYLNADGSMAANTTIGKYKLGKDGAWIK